MWVYPWEALDLPTIVVPAPEPESRGGDAPDAHALVSRGGSVTRPWGVAALSVQTVIPSYPWQYWTAAPCRRS